MEAWFGSNQIARNVWMNAVMRREFVDRGLKALIYTEWAMRRCTSHGTSARKRVTDSASRISFRGGWGIGDVAGRSERGEP